MTDDLIEPSNAEQSQWPQATELYVRGLEGRIEALTEQLEDARLDAKEAEVYSVWLEAKLGKTEDFVRRVIRYAGNNGDDFLADKGREALLELEGEKT